MAYLIDNPPVRDQFYKARNRPLTGCTVLHTAESLMDTVGPDTGAEGVAEFIRTRTTAGSYHDIADSDSYVNLVPYSSGAYHDGTGSNNWALSISFACRTSDWRTMSPQKRHGFLMQGAQAFAAQQAWRKANGYPLTELRLINKAQSDAGMSGFTYHGLRDPGRRTDPGVAAPHLFPFDEWTTHCAAAISGIAFAPEEPDLDADQNNRLTEAWLNSVAAKDNAAAAARLAQESVNWIVDPNRGVLMQLGALARAVAADRDDVDEHALAAAVSASLVPAVVSALASQSAGLTEEQVKAATVAAVREVFADAAS